MIPKHLLGATAGRALGLGVYGGPGVKKTLSIHTLPPPIRMLDVEGGVTPCLPWVRRISAWNDPRWTEFTDEMRLQYYNSILAEKRHTKIDPAPLIDATYFDSMDPDSYGALAEAIANFDTSYYNSLAIDSLHEMSQELQTFAKGKGQETETMHVKNWAGVQERMALQLRRSKNYRDSGVFICLIAGEMIDKDYVTDPRSAPSGRSPEQPFSIKGTMMVPGKMVGVVGHLVDILLHARPLQGDVVWVSKAEPISQGSDAYWEGKDRTGRLPDYNKPNFAMILKAVYGAEVAKQIYGLGT